MNILYIGGGFVGACSAAVSADSGHTTLVYDIDAHKMATLGSNDRDTIESVLFEEGLGDLFMRNRERIQCTADYTKVESFLDTAEVVVMCLPTPEIGETGESDLSFYRQAAERLAEALVKRHGGAQSNYVVIVNKSTVPIHMIDETRNILTKAGVKNFGVVSNPEFLVEGKAIQGSQKPDRVVIGADNENDFAIMRSVYRRFYDSATVKYIEVNPKEAAAGKLLANYLLFAKLSMCFDVVGRTAEAFTGIQFEHLRQILMTDERIGSWGLYDSLYAGGSCFIKDARSLAHQLQQTGRTPALVHEVYLANTRQLELFLARAQQEAGFIWTGKTVALLGTAFKQQTNDIRNSPSIDIVSFAQKNGVGQIRMYDPVALPMMQKQFLPSEKIVYVKDEGEALADADAVIIATDWPQFRSLTEMLLAVPKRPLIMDGRRMLQHRYGDLQQAGFDIIAVGSPLIRGL